MPIYTIVLPDDQDAEVQRELAQVQRETPGLTAAQLVQQYAEQHWRNRAFDAKEQQRHEFTEAILRADPLTIQKIRKDLGLK